jgi:Bax protein
MTKIVPDFYKPASVFMVLIIVLLFSGCEPQFDKVPDFGNVQGTIERKTLFFRFMSPLIKAENDRIRHQRSRLVNLYRQFTDDNRPGWLDRRWLKQLAADYGVELSEPYGPEQWQALLRRVDIVPRELALIQAAVESSWGESRFAKEGHNFYGEHCSAPGCGTVPDDRSPNQTYEVAVFLSPSESIRSYIHNLNTHDAYKNFRHLRFQFRKKEKKPDGHALADTLMAYSERNNDYIREIQDMITDNRELMGGPVCGGVLGQAESLPVCKPSLEAVIEAVTKIYGLREEDLRSSGQKRRPSEARILAAWAVRELTDATLNDLAGRLARDASTLSAAIRRFEVRVKNEPDLAEKVERLKGELEVAIFQAWCAGENRRESNE